VASSPSGRFLATCRYQDLRVHVWDMEAERAGALVALLHGHSRTITSSSFSVHNDRLISCGDEEGKVCLWRLAGDNQEDEGGDGKDMLLFRTNANMPWYVGQEWIWAVSAGR
jgi:WD40 repeat protein